MPDYNIKVEDKFGSLSLIDVAAETAAAGEEWVNQTLTTVNDSVVRLLRDLDKRSPHPPDRSVAQELVREQQP